MVRNTGEARGVGVRSNLQWMLSKDEMFKRNNVNHLNRYIYYCLFSSPGQWKTIVGSATPRRRTKYFSSSDIYHLTV